MEKSKSGTAFVRRPKTIRIPDDMHRALKMKAAEMKISMQDLVDQAVTSILSS